MKSNTSKISAKQLMWLLLLSRAVALLARPTLFRDENNARLTVIGTAVALLVIQTISKLPIQKKANPYDFGRLENHLLIAYFLFSAVISVVQFVVFFQVENEVVYPTVPTVILLMITAYYALSTGLEGIVRVAAIIAVIFACTMGITLVTNMTRMDVSNLILWQPNRDSGAIWNSVINSTFLCPEIPLFLVLRPYLRPEDANQPVFARFYALQAGMIMVFAVSQELVFGSFTNNIPYPVYSLVVVGEFSIFQRLDVLHVGLWVLLTVIRISAFSVSISTLISRLIPTIDHKKFNIFLSLAIGAGAVITMSGLSVKPEISEWILIVLFLSALVAAVLRLFGIGSRKGGVI